MTTGGAAVPAAVLACNVAQGACMTACNALVLAPVPSSLPSQVIHESAAEEFSTEDNRC